MLLYPNLNIKIECFDIYKSSEITKLNNKYKNINFYHINDFDNKKNIYDFSLILDVLHHIDIRKKKIILDIIKNLYIFPNHIKTIFLMILVYYPQLCASQKLLLQMVLRVF